MPRRNENARDGLPTTFEEEQQRELAALVERLGQVFDALREFAEEQGQGAMVVELERRGVAVVTPASA